MDNLLFEIAIMPIKLGEILLTQTLLERTSQPINHRTDRRVEMKGCLMTWRKSQMVQKGLWSVLVLHLCEQSYGVGSWNGESCSATLKFRIGELR